MGITIRPTESRDHDVILALVRDAFATEGHDGRQEVDIVVNTWSRDAVPNGLDRVAVEEGVVVGHVMAARGRLGSREAIGLAPLSVVPSRQGHGIGTALTRDLLARAEAAGWPMVVVLGDPAYYRRFGFEHSGPLGIVYPPVGAGNAYFQVRQLSAFDPSWRGEFSYSWELPVR